MYNYSFVSKEVRDELTPTEQLTIRSSECNQHVLAFKADFFDMPVDPECFVDQDTVFLESPYVHCQLSTDREELTVLI